MRGPVRGALFLGLPYVFLAQPLTDTSIRTAVASLTADGFSSTYGHVSTWNVSRVTNMHGMFNSATAFTGAGIGCWDVSSVTNMYGMLRDATSFNAPIGDWDVSSVTDMDFMLSGATSFNQRLGGQWATSTADKVYMFGNGCPGSIEGKTNSAGGTPM